jgi:hypothetical protein
MAIADIWDQLSAVTPDYSTTSLDVSPQSSIIEDTDPNQTIIDYDDKTTEVIEHGDPIFYLTQKWDKGKSEEDIGTIMDMYWSASKANKHARSFILVYKGSSTTRNLVVKFASVPKREGVIIGRLYKIASVTFKVIGRYSV